MKETNIQKLINIVAKLRDKEKGCPWNKAQTHETLTKYTIEET